MLYIRMLLTQATTKLQCLSMSTKETKKHRKNAWFLETRSSLLETTEMPRISLSILLLHGQYRHFPNPNSVSTLHKRQIKRT